MKYSRTLPGLLLLLLPLAVASQSAIRLEDCLQALGRNHPLAQTPEMLDGQLQQDLRAIGTGRLPQLDLSAQATYQSDVTQLPSGGMPGLAIEPPNKDQYRAILELNQRLFDGGRVGASEAFREAAARAGKQQVAVDLHSLKYAVLRYYMSVLLLQEQQDLAAAREKQLRERLSETEAAIAGGAALPASGAAIRAEYLSTVQLRSDLERSRESRLEQLSILTGLDLPVGTTLVRPQMPAVHDTAIQRPEEALFDYQAEQVDRSAELKSRSRLPVLDAFAQGGYGNPGLNMLDNTFSTFFYGGVRLRWNVFDWHRTHAETESLRMEKDLIESRRRSFELQTRSDLSELRNDIGQLAARIATDRKLIALRETILQTAESQLRNGVMRPSEYLADFTDLYDARNALSLHRIQLLQKQIQYQLTQGTYETQEPQ